MTNRILAILSTLSIASSCIAGKVHIGDIGVTQIAGRIETGIIDEATEEIDTSVRTHRSEFGDEGTPAVTTEPGFDAEHIFNPSFRIGFTMLNALRVWDGTKFVPTGGETLIMSFLTLERQTGSCIVDGFDLAVDPDGGWHRHFTFFLAPGPGNVRDDGVYAIKLRLYATQPSLAPSDPFWIVFRHNASEADQTSAIDWINNHYVTPTCPGDVNFNNVVGIGDLLSVIGNWGVNPCTSGDVNQDGIIGIADLLGVIGEWGVCD